MRGFLLGPDSAIRLDETQVEVRGEAKAEAFSADVRAAQRPDACE